MQSGLKLFFRNSMRIIVEGSCPGGMEWLRDSETEMDETPDRLIIKGIS